MFLIAAFTITVSYSEKLSCSHTVYKRRVIHKNLPLYRFILTGEAGREKIPNEYCNTDSTVPNRVIHMWFKRASSDIALQAKVQALEIKIETLRLLSESFKESLEAMEARHERLRGRFYAAKMHKPEEDKPPTKAELLRKAGFVPGKPMVHHEE